MAWKLFAGCRLPMTYAVQGAGADLPGARTFFHALHAGGRGGLCV